MALDSYDWLKIATSSAVIGSAMGAIINGLFARGKDRRERDRESFLAALLAVEELEGYMRACVQMIYTDGEAQQEAVQRGSHEPLDRVHLPAFSYPKDIQWKWLPNDMAADLREFPNAHRDTAQHIRNRADFYDPCGTCDDITLGCARLGIQAWKLAAKGRYSSGLPAAQLHQYGENAMKALHDRILKHEHAVKSRQSAPSTWALHVAAREQQPDSGTRTT
ncbi:hypothetical protein [Burkholderia sp. Ac-20353]|uniref:hypothetical protein n=1 Tax=Burkholderia sp. Ac-20353 TaxID=2703894 RepID=UPI00197C2618|nr:hypothetical protein [Burkholderia sp. Ac-20353]MBN3786761.1 hypothetical protein [Burkholderia sp. Ac-20353]